MPRKVYQWSQLMRPGRHMVSVGSLPVSADSFRRMCYSAAADYGRKISVSVCRRFVVLTVVDQGWKE